jgi:hypothetical protein
MKEIIFKRNQNLLIKFKPLKVFVDDKLIDYIEPEELEKTIYINESSKELKVGVHKRLSNTVDLTKSIPDVKKIGIRVTSQIPNALFIIIYGCFFVACASVIFPSLLNNLYLSAALFSPLFILIYWETIGRKNYLRLSRFSESDLIRDLTSQT